MSATSHWAPEDGKKAQTVQLLDASTTPSGVDDTPAISVSMAVLVHCCEVNPAQDVDDSP
ncbi:MAG: hypothetical protein LQ348_003789 [Seirophora lacunosa]|nr:MAG: hypothetical protein LQ348_003789 [Seirophora lacunosa]